MAGKPGVIYLQKDRFHLYSPFLQQIVEFRFAPEVVRDSDVFDKELLASQVKVFVVNGRIQPSSLYIVLADNAYFVKDFVLPAPPPQQKNAPPPPAMTMETIHVMSMDFIEHVPYENVVSKTIPLKNGVKVCAVNKDFYDAVKEGFTKLGFTVEGIFPGIILGNNLSTKPVLDGAIVNTVLQKAGTFKQYDLMLQEVFKPEARKTAETSVEMELEEFEVKSGKPDKKRLYLMVGVMAVLLIILVFVYIGSNESPPPPAATSEEKVAASVVQAPSPTISIASEVSPSVPAGPQIDPEEAKLLTAQLTNTAAPAIAVEKLRTALGKFGFASMNTQTQPSVSTSQTIVIFSLLPSTEMRTAVLLEVKKVTPNVQVQEKSDASTDITILLGK